MSQLGIVAIGRNEGERLRRCLCSVLGRGLPVVYVDSGSNDGSPELARSLSAEVVELDDSQPVNAPRARNAGFERLAELDPDFSFVQFIDGDCEMVDGWLEQGLRMLEQRPDVGLVTGHRRERFREQSIYNRLADLEWDLPVGEIKGTHGDMMVRAEAFRQIGGFNVAVPVSEDFDLCIRLQNHGWILVRIDQEMTLHDMAMTRFSQWWWRSVRSGYGYANAAALYAKSPNRHFMRDVRSIILWGLALPLAALVLAWPTRGYSLLLLSSYGLLYWRVLRYGTHRGWSPPDARLYAFWCVLSKFPMLVGLSIHWYRRVTRRPKRIIEYKGAGKADSSSRQQFGLAAEGSNRSS